MFVLAPLLSLAGLAHHPFVPLAERSIEIQLEDENENEPEIIRGRVDVLVSYHQLWMIAIESKQKGWNVTEALPQALISMMSAPDRYPAFGLALNGTEFLFIKLIKTNSPQYALSRLFSLRNSGNDLYTVLSTLKKLKQIVLP